MEAVSISRSPGEAPGLNHREENARPGQASSVETSGQVAAEGHDSTFKPPRFQDLAFRIHGWPALGRRAVEQRHRHLHRRQASDAVAGPAMPNNVEAIAMMSVGLAEDGNGSLVQVSTVIPTSIESPTGLPLTSDIPLTMTSVPALLSSSSAVSSQTISSSTTSASQTSATSISSPSVTPSSSSSSPSSLESTSQQTMSTTVDSSSSPSSSLAGISSSTVSSPAAPSSESSGTQTSPGTTAPTSSGATEISKPSTTGNSTGTASMSSSTFSSSLATENVSVQYFSGNSTSSAMHSATSAPLPVSTHTNSTSISHTSSASRSATTTSSSLMSESTRSSTKSSEKSSTSTTSSEHSSSSSSSAPSTTLASSQPTTSAFAYAAGTNIGAVGTSATSAIPHSTSASSSSASASSESGSGSGSGMAAPMPAVVGGVVGGIAGLALLLVLTLLFLRWKKQKSRTMSSIGGGDADYGTSRENIEHNGLPGGMAERSSRTPLAAATSFGTTGLLKLLRPLSQQTASTTETGPSQRGFEKISGRKLPSLFSPGVGDGYPGNSREAFAASSIYGEEPGFYGTGGATESPFVGGGAFEHSGHPPANWMAEEVPSWQTTPSRTPVANQAGFPTPMPRGSPVPRRPLPPDGLGRSHPSHDGSRSSRFTENIT